MNKVEIQPFQLAKKHKCNCCDRLERIERRLVLWQDNQVVGDLELCEQCLMAMLNIINGQEEIIEKWEFQKGGMSNG